MNPFLFDEFNGTPSATWKQKIQVDLKGANYNETLVGKTDEGFSINPFYTNENSFEHEINLPKKGFSICQSIFISNEKTANLLAIDALKRGANALEFTALQTFDYQTLLKNIDTQKQFIYFKFQFISVSFIIELANFINSKNTYFHIDIISNLAKTGNWFSNLKEDHHQLKKIIQSTSNCISVNASLYQNAGATIVQQLAYALAHANEYLNYFEKDVEKKIHFNFSVGSNYFFEIAKLRAFRILWETLLKEYKTKNATAHIFTQPSNRNKTLYDYNTNMLRTTTECMSAILGGSNTISNSAYDTVYHKKNEFGERIARNQLLILQQESYLSEAQNIANGTYYIETLTEQLCQKALLIFKQIEKGGGFLNQLKKGIIQRKIRESANKEQEKFDTNKLVLVGTNKLENSKDRMKNNLEIFPFVKTKNHKTLIVPIIQKRLAESLEKERLTNE